MVKGWAEAFPSVRAGRLNLVLVEMRATVLPRYSGFLHQLNPESCRACTINSILNYRTAVLPVRVCGGVGLVLPGLRVEIFRS